jgi:hypothetical protein
VTDVFVTGIDVDAYLTKVAAERLAGIGLRPRLTTCDATGPLRGTYDRIVSTVVVGRSRRPRATVTPDGVCHLRRERWQATAAL